MSLIRLDETTRGDVPKGVDWLRPVTRPAIGDAWPTVYELHDGSWRVSSLSGSPSDGSLKDEFLMVYGVPVVWREVLPSEDLETHDRLVNGVMCRPAEPHEIPREGSRGEE